MSYLIALAAFELYSYKKGKKSFAGASSFLFLYPFPRKQKANFVASSGEKMDFDVHSGIELVKKNELQRVSTIFSKLKINR